MKNKLNNFIKNNKWLLITFIVSSIIISIIYTLQKIAPFGNNTMLDVDFYHQYGPLLNELYDRVQAGKTLLYSFNTGGGIPFYRNFLNYLSSPFNIILFLFQKKDIVMAFSIIIGLKAIFASCTMSYYLKKVFKKDGYLTCVFGILYAFSGYFCAYYWNIMWLDGMVFLPIIMYGINKLINEEQPLLYLFTLAIMLIANYFIGYMICLYSVLYFAVCMIYKHDYKIKNIIKRVLMFFISSLLAGALCAFLLIPLYYALKTTSATGGGLPIQVFNFGLKDYLFNHIPGVSRTVFASDILPLPNVYCGLITLVSIILIFINNKIKLKTKLLTIFMLLFFLISFNVAKIDYVWHAFHVPNDLPWRYSFLYVFSLVTLGYYSTLKLNDTSKIRVSISFAIITLIILLSYKLGFKNITSQKVITCVILLFCYYLTYIFSFQKELSKKFLECLLIIFVSAEAVYGINSNWNINHDLKTFMSDKNNYESLIKETKNNDNDLYRLEKTSTLTLNDGAWYNYHGMSTFTSMAYEKTAKFQRMIGMSGNNINSYYYHEYQTPVYNTMFDIKYVLGNYINNDYYTFLDSNESANLTKYNYSSSLVYMLDKNIKKYYLESYMPFLNQSNFVKQGTGISDIYKILQVKNVTNGSILNNDFYKYSNGEFSYQLDDNSIENAITFNLTNDKDQDIYLYIGGSNVSSFVVDGKYYSLTSDEYYTFDTGKLKQGNVAIRINLKSKDTSTIKFYAYTINDEAFKNFYNYIQKGKLKVTRYSDTLIEGTINAENNQIAFTSISYDKGWSAYVDGKKVSIYKIADTYLSFNVPSGKHNIKLVYYPYKMSLGLVISGISVIFIIIYILKNKKNRRKD